MESAENYFLLTFLVILGLVTANTVALRPSYNLTSLNRGSFPADFIFGTGSSAYQNEGAAAKEGKGPSIWDTFIHTYPGKIVDGSNGNVATDSYHRYKEDVGIMKEMGLDAYRFSISWSRILPNGKLSGGINRKGIKYYNKLINELLANGIKPFVTLFHWDLPQALEDEYGGFLSPNIVNDFKEYAEVCFHEFGDRVKHWMTLNEPYAFSMYGYGIGAIAPGRCSKWLGSNCSGGDSRTEPYLTAHHQLLAHAKAVKLYKQKYQNTQKGVIGITLHSNWFVPFAKKELDFMLGWFMDPLSNGDYPQILRSIVGNRLPKFSKKESKMMKGSFDFIGLNYYHAASRSHFNSLNAHANLTGDRHGAVLIGPRICNNYATSNRAYAYPKGIQDLLLYVKGEYNNPLIYITENGVEELTNSTLTLIEAIVDNMRIDYHYHHLSFLQRAIKDGVNVKGYFAWSLLDSFEWVSGYTLRFGINYVDYKDNLKRYPKLSAYWFKSFLMK